MFEKAKPQNKKFKLFLIGPEGTFKTRLMLRLLSAKAGPPVGAVIDTEFGTDHYSGEFNFGLEQTADADEIMKLCTKLSTAPGDIKALGIDSFSVYYESLVSKYVDLYLKREKTSVGNKVEYYTLQPRDYQPITREAGKLIRLLMQCDLNVICTAQQKDLWDQNMKIVGTTHDGWKRLPYYFDTVIEIIPDGRAKGSMIGHVKRKDRTGSFKVGEKIPWENDEQVYRYLVSKFGCDFTGGPKAVPVKEAIETNTEVTADAKPKNEDKTAQKEDAATTSKEQPNEDPAAGADGAACETTAADHGDAEESTQPDTSGPARKDQLFQIVKLKKEAQITAPEDWAKLLVPYNVATAKEMTAMQADAFIEELIGKTMSPF
ncbi:MAG: AAA family ATPase [Desulfobacterales bacterium]|jgi:hypothetical protein|nr:AAA family ATPase [Desulfobacterales bacterium]